MRYTNLFYLFIYLLQQIWEWRDICSYQAAVHGQRSQYMLGTGRRGVLSPVDRESSGMLHMTTKQQVITAH